MKPYPSSRSARELRDKRVELVFSVGEHIKAVAAAAAVGLPLATFCRVLALAEGAKIQPKAPVIDQAVREAIASMGHVANALDRHNAFFSTLVDELQKVVDRTNPQMIGARGKAIQQIFEETKLAIADLSMRVDEVRAALVSKV